MVERSQVPYDLIEGLPPGHAEQQPEMWLEAVVEAVGALERRGEIRGIGVSGQQHGAVLLGEQYEVVRAAKLWCDTSTSAEAAALSAELVCDSRLHLELELALLKPNLYLISGSRARVCVSIR